MRVPHPVPSRRVESTEAEDRNLNHLIVLDPTTPGLTLLDTDLDIDPTYPDIFTFDSDLDLGTVLGEEVKEEEEGEEFWKKFLPPDNDDLYIPESLSYPSTSHDCNGNDLGVDTTPLFDFGIGTVAQPEIQKVESESIEYSSADNCKDLFKWDFARYSFPSRQIRIAQSGHKPKTKQAPVSKEQDLENRDELERIKREIRGALGINTSSAIDSGSAINTKVKEVEPKRQRTIKVTKEEEQERIIQDLLGEYIQEESISILDMDNEDLSAEPVGRGRGYKWAGPVRDIETGRPVTPYKDDPDSVSGPSRKQTARRGSKPFPTSSASSRGSSSRGRGGTVRGDSPRLEPVGGIRPNLEGQASWVRTDRTVPNKASTSSLPSKSSSTTRSHHHPSMPPKVKAPTRPTHNPKSPYFELISKRQARSSVPPEFLHSTNELQRSVIRDWANSRASPETQKAIIDLLEWLSHTINLALCPYKDQKKATRRFEVDVFGSVAWGGETGSSGDLDLVVLDRELSQGYHPDFWRVKPGEVAPPLKKSARSYQTPDNLPRVYDMWKFTAVLRQIGMSDVNCIRHASTPIIKFKTSKTGIKLDCDVNVNDLGGWYNSSLILAYCEISPYVLRPLVHALKLWASAHDLNDPAGARGPATMSSYCLTLLAIGYLQQRGHLPNLQAKINVPIPSHPTDTDDPDLIWVSWGKQQGLAAHIAFSKTPPKDWGQKDKDLTAAGAIRGFFKYFSSTSESRFDREGSIISVLNGGVVPRSEKYLSPLMGTKESRMEREPYMGTGVNGIQPSNWRERLLIVQDPFIWQKSCTSAMHVNGLARWFATVDRTHQILESAGEAATIRDILIPLPAPVKQAAVAGPSRGGGTGGDRVARYAKRFAASRGSGRGRGIGNGNGNGNGQGESSAGPAVEKLLDI